MQQKPALARVVLPTAFYWKARSAKEKKCPSGNFGLSHFIESPDRWQKQSLPETGF